MSKKLAPVQNTTALDFQNMDFAQWAQRDLTDTFEDAYFHFLASLQSKNTRRAYARDILEFWQFLKSHNLNIQRLSQLNERMLLSWQHHLAQNHNQNSKAESRTAQSTLARKISAVSSLLEFALKRKIIPDNPAKLLKRPRIKRESRTNAFTWDELTKMLAVCAEKRDQLKSIGGREYRSWALRHSVLATLFSVGMRAQELCELRICDLEITPSFAKLHMTAKGNESHAPILHPKTTQLLQDYLKEFRSSESVQAPLFVRAQKVNNEVPLTQSALFAMIQAVAKEAEVNKKVSPHSCRATLATLLHNEGVPIGQIQDLLNHKQITTTAIYLKKAQELEDAAALKIDILGGRVL